MWFAHSFISIKWPNQNSRINEDVSLWRSRVLFCWRHNSAPVSPVASLVCVFLQWAEAQTQCKRLKLQDLVISPMQRLTKYKLLLKAILKKTDKESHRKDLIQMVSVFFGVWRHVDNLARDVKTRKRVWRNQTRSIRRDPIVRQIWRVIGRRCCANWCYEVAFPAGTCSNHTSQSLARRVISVPIPRR